MPSAKSSLASGTRVVGQLSTDGDLLVEGHLEGGPLRVGGGLTVGESATVQCADAEVGDALVIGLFQGTLRARGVVRIHQSGRVMGDILATRVVFVSEPPPSTRTPPAVTALPPAAPAVSPPAPAPPAAALATIAPPPATSLAMPHAEPPHALPSPSTPQVAEPARSRTKASTPPPRVIPTLPSIGQRAMERKD